MIVIKHDIKELGSTLDRFQKRQLPFATARALTAVAKAAAVQNERALPMVTDKPTPFSRRAFGSTAATKAMPWESSVFIKDVQARYLGKLETGGERTPPKTALVMPVQQKLNQYGNIPNKALARAKARKDTFVGTVKGTGGFWQRTKDGGVKLLAAFRPKAKYEPQLGFFERVRVNATLAMPVVMKAALTEALRTARRR